MELACDRSSLSIYDGEEDPSTRLADMCSLSSHLEYTSSGDAMLLHLKSSGDNANSSFTVVWNAVGKLNVPGRN